MIRTIKFWMIAAISVAGVGEAAAAAPLPTAPPPTALPSAAPIDVMVLGTYHFANPGADINNVKADDVLSARRQDEIEAVAAAIARFRPTKVMVEREVSAPDLVDAGYAKFGPRDLARDRSERVQIAYRVARLAGLPRVYGIDEQPGKGEPDYFPFELVTGFANRKGQDAKLGAIMAAGPAMVAKFERMQPMSSIAELLIDWNNTANPIFGMSFYYGLLGIGDTEAQPGAVLNAGWYLRNAKIFGKLMTAARPGDRVLVVYGAGHCYWLRHFARETPGYRNVDPLPYLEAAAKR